MLAAVRSGWPGTVDAELTPYKHRADELSTDADCVLWGGRVVVPTALRDRVKRQLHEGHTGCTKMKQLARRFVWWPGLDAELEALARGCPACESKRAAPPHAERHPWEPAQGPWQRVHADFAGPLKDTWFLVMVDSFSKWVEMIPMKTTTSERTVAVMRAVFARLGLPLVLVTDNGPQFTSQEFAQFAASNGIRHVRVAPHHPSSNGLAERAVGSLKNSLKATLAAGGGGGVELALARVLMAYRATPHASTGRTPAEMLFGRNIRTRLNLLIPTAEDALRDSAERQHMAAGGRARSFDDGAEVWARCYSGPQKWVRGRVVTRTGPVSYEVDVGRGRLWSRHCDQLLSAAPDSTAPADAVDHGREDAEALASNRCRLPTVGRDGDEGSGVSSGGANLSRSAGASEWAADLARAIGAGAEGPAGAAVVRPAGAAVADPADAGAAARAAGVAAGRSAGARATSSASAAPASDSAGGLQDEAPAGEPNCGRARDGATAERAAAAAELVPNESATARLGAEARTAGRADSPRRCTELSELRHSTRSAAPPRRYIEEV